LHFDKVKPLKKSDFTVIGIILLCFAILGENRGKAITYETVQEKTDSLIQFALHHQGIPHRKGGTTPRGFDCSGFTQYVFNYVDIPLNRSAATQFNQGMEISPEQLQKGDLVFFRIGSRINHVGVVTHVTPEESTFIHVSSSYGIRLDHLQNAYYKKYYVGARRMTLLPSPS
jgi:cell wall-associated NlpC family hydrolase